MNKIINVLDQEFTCWQGGVIPPGQVREVIEIGLCEVDLDARRIVRKVSIPVIPVRSTVSDYCTKLTGWTEAKLRRQGVPLHEAHRRLLDKHGSLGRLTVVDSDDEFDTLRAQCEALGLVFPFGGQLNISTVLKLLRRNARNQSLDAKLAAFGLQFEGRKHRADDDAFNIARLLLAWLSASAGCEALLAVKPEE